MQEISHDAVSDTTFFSGEQRRGCRRRSHLNNAAMWATDLERTGPVEIEGQGKWPPADSFWNVLIEFDVTNRFANGIRWTYRSPQGLQSSVANTASIASTVLSTSTWPPSGPTRLLWTTAL